MKTEIKRNINVRRLRLAAHSALGVVKKSEEAAFWAAAIGFAPYFVLGQGNDKYDEFLPVATAKFIGYVATIPLGLAGGAARMPILIPMAVGKACIDNLTRKVANPAMTAKVINFVDGLEHTNESTKELIGHMTAILVPSKKPKSKSSKHLHKVFCQAKPGFMFSTSGMLSVSTYNDKEKLKALKEYTNDTKNYGKSTHNK